MANTRFFTFVDRYIPLQFFEEDPVTVTLFVSDETDKKFDAMQQELRTATDYKKKYKLLCNLVGAENAEKLMERADAKDDYAISQIILYIHRSYTESRTKNLTAAASGKVK